MNDTTCDQMFATKGYSGPHAVLTELQAAEFARQCEASIWRSLPVGRKRPNLYHRHLDCAHVFRICTLPQILAAVQSVLGTDVLLHTSDFFIKEPGASEIPWHQDGLNLFVDDALAPITVWLALDACTLENGCLELIPGSHRAPVEHRSCASPYLYGVFATPEATARAASISVQMKPGEMLLFHSLMLHRSGPNLSPSRRAGLSIRYLRPNVRINHDAIFAGHKAVLVSGADEFSINRVAFPSELDLK
jgi:ectoine hydroxylase-related dioxygenase (phytanoyl-CoA dioxygenase family)